MLQQNIKVAADAIVFNRKGAALYVLLIQRKNEPFKGQWAFPGGFVEDDEDLLPAAIRELEEETGLHLETMEQLITVGTPGRDSRFRTVSVVYMAVLNEYAAAVKGNDDAADAQWFDIKQLPGLAFDHKEIMEVAVKKLPKMK